MATKILIANNDVVFRRSLSSILRKENYDVYEAENGGEVIEFTLKETPDLIILDLILSEKDICDVCAELANNACSSNIPIIFLTDLQDPEYIVKGFDLGAVDHISKFFDHREILARIKNQIRIRWLTQSLVVTNNRLLEKHQQLEEDLQAAASIQKSLILKTPPQIAYLDVAWQYMPCDRVGGDIFNIYQLDEMHLAIFILDVSGHGVPAAMVAVSVSQSLSPQTGALLKTKAPPPKNYDITPPAEVLKQLDVEYPIERFGKYFTISYMLFNFRTGQLRYSSAGHLPPVLVRHHGDYSCLNEGGTIIGLGGMVPFEEGEIYLNPGDRLFLYTDGIVEFANRHDDAFGEERFYNQLMSTRTKPLRLACEEVIQELLIYGEGTKPQDDISLLAIEYQQSHSG